MGFSTGEWHGDILTVKTTHIKKEFYRRSGLPSSDMTTLVEHWIPHGNILSHVSVITDPVYATRVEPWVRHGKILSHGAVITDPVYLTEPYVTSEEFALMERGNQNWLYN